MFNVGQSWASDGCLRRALQKKRKNTIVDIFSIFLQIHTDGRPGDRSASNASDTGPNALSGYSHQTTTKPPPPPWMFATYALSYIEYPGRAT